MIENKNNCNLEYISSDADTATKLRIEQGNLQNYDNKICELF